MPLATYARTDFRGGLWGKWSQGRHNDPKYLTALNACLNGLPVETGTWVRRPGFSHAGFTRGGAPGRAIRFDFEEVTAPYSIEFTDGHMRLRSGLAPVTTNDSTAVTSISSANPAVMTVGTAVTWATGDQVFLSGLSPNPLIENRVLALTKLTTTTFSLTDAITGANINGASLAAIGANAVANRILDITTPYIGGSWAMLRSVQAEETAIFLQGTVAPQALSTTADPMGSTFATFQFGAVTFEDGPYLDPPTNGAQLTANQLTGIVQLTLSFPTWVSTTSYAAGDFVTDGSINWESLIDQNINNPPIVSQATNNSTAAGNATLHFASTTNIVVGMTITNSTHSTVIPANTTVLSKTSNTVVMSANATGAGVSNGDTIVFTSPSAWSQTSGNAVVNNGQGFLQTDIGRLIRLFSEPAIWLIGSTYAAGAVVSYNPSGMPGQTTYWQSLTSSNVGNAPGTDLTNWEILEQGGTSSPSIWTWGKITSLLSTIPNNPSGIAQIGNMTGNGGLSAAFNGNTDQNGASSAETSNANSGSTGSSNESITGYVGQNFSGCSTTSYDIQSATVYPSSDEAFAQITLLVEGTGSPTAALSNVNLVAYLYGSNSAPGSATNGTLLGQTAVVSGASYPAIGIGSQTYSFGSGPINISSNNTTTSYKYLWVVFGLSYTITGTKPPFSTLGWTATAALYVAQVELVPPPGTGSTASGVNIELLGPALLYSQTIRTWRLGVYSNTTGWPTCGTYIDGRIALSGVVANRVDMCVANGITNDSAGTTINFAPTDQYDNVLDSSGISVVFDAPDANPLYWMVPDQQGILAGTPGGEWLIYAPTQGGFAPNNIAARRVTKIGVANIEPQRTEHTIVFVQKFLRKIVEYFADVFSGKFTAPNIIQDAKQLTVNDIQELAYQQELAPEVWARVNYGLIGCTYKRDTLMTSQGPTMNGWHQHTLGNSGNIEYLCNGSSVDGNLDALTIVSKDPTTGLRSVLILGDILDEGSTLAEASYVDSGITPTSTSAVAVGAGFPYGGLQLNGLWPLNGLTVTAWLGGLDCGDYVVSNGSIQVPFGDGIGGGQGSFPAATNRNDQGLFTASFVSTGITGNNITMWTGTMPMRVGFTYTSRGQITRPLAPQESGARNGPAFGKQARNHYMMLQVEGTQGVSFGNKFNDLNQPLTAASFKMIDNVTPYTIDQQFTGIYRDQPNTDYSFDEMPCWQVTRPFICNVNAVGAATEAQDI